MCVWSFWILGVSGVSGCRRDMYERQGAAPWVSDWSPAWGTCQRLMPLVWDHHHRQQVNDYYTTWIVVFNIWAGIRYHQFKTEILAQDHPLLTNRMAYLITNPLTDTKTDPITDTISDFITDTMVVSRTDQNCEARAVWQTCNSYPSNWHFGIFPYNITLQSRLDLESRICFHR